MRKWPLYLGQTPCYRSVSILTIGMYECVLALSSFRADRLLIAPALLIVVRR